MYTYVCILCKHKEDFGVGSGAKKGTISMCVCVCVCICVCRERDKESRDLPVLLFVHAKKGGERDVPVFLFVCYVSAHASDVKFVTTLLDFGKRY
jgi:hypothetical protein